MKIVKTTTKSFNIKCGCNSENWGITFGRFIETRNKSNLPTSYFEKCFICGRKFKDNEIPNIVIVSEKGNRFSCNDCYGKIESEVE